ncbi:MAG: hypothetical protein M3355_04440 [Actinomycetota bacterium]|nr:hypothetical protein [Actinomycetota bacterium]
MRLKLERPPPDEKYVNQAMRNGGFPLPAPGGSERLVESGHDGCSGRTRVRLPTALPTRAVRRVVCEHCAETFDAAEVVEIQPGRKRLSFPALPAISLPARLPSRPNVSMPAGLDARWLTLPVAALAVFVVLSLMREDNPTTQSIPAAAEAPDEQAAKAGGPDKSKAAGRAQTPVVPTDAQLVAESTFSLALPPGWDRVTPAAGATFAAVSPDSSADATLWIQSDPKLDMAAFEANSLEQLEVLAGSARVVDRQLGPTVESSSITLAPKGAPDGIPAVKVTLRGSGDNWFYLATTIQPGASAGAVAGVELIQGSFVAQGSAR